VGPGPGLEEEALSDGGRAEVRALGPPRRLSLCVMLLEPFPLVPAKAPPFTPLATSKMPAGFQPSNQVTACWDT